jgi:pimeloyl-ACP methyl ester carboxylesterase
MLLGRMAKVTTRSFRHDGHRLVYDDYGAGPQTVVLLPGLLLSRRMHAPMAGSLAERGYRVLCLDFLGHGASDRPEDMTTYSMTLFAEQVVALLDELDIDEAVVGGTSLGANVSLEVAALAPERLRGVVIEMPVLDNALLACALFFTPLLVALTFGAPLTRLVARLAQRIPERRTELANVVLDAIRQDPGPSGAILQGLFFGRIAPPRSERQSLATKALVLGHPRDPIHPFSDADMLVRELPDVRLVRANSILELRVRPERLTDEIAQFVDDCWAVRPLRRRRRRATA